MKLYELDALTLFKMLKKKETSSEEIVKSYFDRIEKVEQKIDAFITLCKDEAIKQAIEIDKNGVLDNSSKICGLPIGIKDNISTKGILTTCASKMLYNYVPCYDAFVVDKIKKAGGIILGKLNMDEFAMGSSNETSYFKITKNPHNTQYVPGGSSGGSAASVASCETLFALGSDTGGSIRQPASFCGVVGFKPTYGTVSRYGLIAFASSLDQIGPIAKTVDDAAILYEVISGHDSMDATSFNIDSYKYDLENIDISYLKGKTVALVDEYMSESIYKEGKDKVNEIASILEKNGVNIINISLPSLIYGLPAYYVISSAEASSNLARFDGVSYGYRSENCENLNDLYVNSRTEGFGTEVKRRIMLGTFVLSSGYFDAYYKRAKILQNKIIEQMNDCFLKCDFLLTPTTPTPSFKIGAEITDPSKMHANDLCTVCANIAGMPAISIPFGKTTDNLPIGVQLYANRFKDSEILKAAKVIEQLREPISIPDLD